MGLSDANRRCALKFLAIVLLVCCLALDVGVADATMTPVDDGFAIVQVRYTSRAVGNKSARNHPPWDIQRMLLRLRAQDDVQARLLFEITAKDAITRLQYISVPLANAQTFVDRLQTEHGEIRLRWNEKQQRRYPFRARVIEEPELDFHVEIQHGKWFVPFDFLHSILALRERFHFRAPLLEIFDPTQE